MPLMRSYLAGNQAASIPLLTAALIASGFEPPTIAQRINVTELGLAVPRMVVLDVDDLDIDPFELMRMIRFVLPLCLIAVYGGTLEQSWALSCHLAGANCVLSKTSNEEQLVAGLREGLTSGCFTDPSFVAAQIEALGPRETSK
jgi:DNA-binding NarL/FixJ family response regulator